MLTRRLQLPVQCLRRLYSPPAMQNPQLEAPVHRGMAHLDRSAFSQQLSLLAARLPATKTTQFMHKDAKECVCVSIRGDSERPACEESRGLISTAPLAVAFTRDLLRRRTASSSVSAESAPSARTRRSSTAEYSSELQTKVRSAARILRSPPPHADALRLRLGTAALPEELLQMIKQSDGEVVQHQVELTYDFWTAGTPFRELAKPAEAQI